MTATSEGLSAGLSMPQDAAAEASVLGAMLLWQDACAEAISVLRPSDFYLPLHERLFALMEELFVLGNPVDIVTVAAAAAKAGLSHQVQNGAYLSRLSETPATPASVGYYAQIVKGKSTLRKVAAASLQGFHESTSPSADPDETPGRVLTNVLQAATEHLPEGGVTAGEAAEEALSWIERRLDKSYTPLTTGYPDLDELLTEISPGQLVLIAARPATGKSVALLDIARHMAVTQGKETLLFSLEMSAWEIGLRLVSSHSGIKMETIKAGKLDDAQWNIIATAVEELQAAPLTIETNPHMTVADLRARAVRHKRKKGLAAIVVDYLGLLAPATVRKDHYVEVGEITRGLKILAKDVAPVIAAAQLNRNSEHRPDKRPALADLRDSGSLEQDSDVVLLLHREDMYDPNTLRAGEVDIIVAKNRNGASGTVTLAAQLDKARFVSLYSGL